ncbi:MAG: shikimate kinase [Gemmatimonadales bacterium]
MKRHIVLVGLPGSGKSAVGRLVARELEAPFLDIDRAVTERAGASVAAIFAELGEAGFRELEREEAERALGGPAAVVAPGGGWAAQPGNLEAISKSALVVHLETDPAIAWQRVAQEGGRPLLEATDPIARMGELERERIGAYRQAAAVVNTDRLEPREVARRVVELARSMGGW